MPQRCRLILFLFSLFLSISVDGRSQAAQPAASRLRFRVKLEKELSPAGASGRLIVFMTDSPQQRETLNTGFVPGATWIAAMEVEHLAPGGVLELDPDLLAFPRPFSEAKPGTWQVMALLDPNHTYAYHGEDEGDLKSAVRRLENVDPARAGTIELTLSRRLPARFTPADTENVKLVEFQSPLLTRFWGRPIVMRAGVALPRGYGTDVKTSYPVVYHVHGFGGDHTGAWRQGVPSNEELGEGRRLPMIHVYLDGSFPTGHHEFADSVNNGPWGRALTEELIPHLEKRFRAEPRPRARFLTGHSSGGWSTLWLQVTYPDFFGGTWSTAPDPVDLRSWTGINATPGSKDNAYREADGSPKQLVRRGGKWIASIEEFARQEEVLGEYGGQFASFEWVWSPRGPDGRPLKLFNRVSGELNPEVLKYWEKYDIRLILERNWTKLGPKLRGKIHVICGDADTFRLEEGVKLLCGFFKGKGSDAVCELVPERDHGNLYQPYQTYPDGLGARIQREMEAAYRQAASARTKR
ncbi:MAG: alpha/beta hydrolase [Blastocatellia bacterium]